jgi:hypothetical protein
MDTNTTDDLDMLADECGFTLVISCPDFGTMHYSLHQGPQFVFTATGRDEAIAFCTGWLALMGRRGLPMAS